MHKHYCRQLLCAQVFTICIEFGVSPVLYFFIHSFLDALQSPLKTGTQVSSMPMYKFNSSSISSTIFSTCVSVISVSFASARCSPLKCRNCCLLKSNRERNCEYGRNSKWRAKWNHFNETVCCYHRQRKLLIAQWRVLLFGGANFMDEFKRMRNEARSGWERAPAHTCSIEWNILRNENKRQLPISTPNLLYFEAISFVSLFCHCVFILFKVFVYKASQIVFSTRFHLVFCCWLLPTKHTWDCLLMW